MKRVLILFVLLLITSQAFAITDTNLVAYWKVDESSGNAVDSKGIYTLTNVGTVTYSAGKIGNAVNPTDSKYLSNASFVNTFTEASWSLWYQTSNYTLNQVIFHQGESGGFGNLFINNDVTTGKTKAVFGNGSSTIIVDTNTGVSNNTWNHIVVTAKAGGLLKIYLNGVLQKQTTYSAFGSRGTTITYGAENSGTTTNNLEGKIDEIGFFNKELSSTDVTDLYNAGNGITYCSDGTFSLTCTPIDVNFNYIIRKDLNKILLTDTSTTKGTVSKTAWTWTNNGSTISTDQNYNLTATQLTDYNICLFVDTNVTDVNGTKCYSFNSGDWTPPVTTFSSSQIENTTINTLTFTCTDNNSGCKWTTYKIDNNALWTTITNTGTKDINFSGTGDHNIQYYSTDNSDNNETTKTSTFTTYGNARFRIKDQNSGLDLNGTQINFNGSDYVSGSNVYDFNLQELTATNTPYLFTISKTGYSTRYYQIDLNYFSEFDTNFALLPDSLDSDVPFKVYKTDETTIFSNTYVEVKDSDTNWTVGRLKTSSTGEATFNLRTDDSNYISIVNNGEFTYSPVTVTVLYPKNEETLAQITEKWKIEITQNLYASYSDLNANKIIYLLPNTALPYNIKISDMNGNYFPRTYAKIYPGNPLTDTLQPYLINTTTGLLTTIRSVSAYTNQPVPNITVKIYKFISGQGRTYVEQILTDAKGEALTYAVLGAAYEYEIYSGATLIRIDAITATSSTVYIRIDDETYTPPTYQGGLFSVNFNPLIGTLSSFDKNLIQTISIFDLNSTTTISNVILQIINTSINGTDGNDAIIYSLVIPYTDQNSITNNFDINSTSKIIEGVPYDTNGFIIIKVIIQTSDGNFVAFQTYKPFTGVNPLFDVGFGSRNFFGCDSYYDAQGNPNPLIPCPNQLFLALIISFILVAGFSFEMQFTNPTGLGLMFLLIMGFFTFITWIPIILYGLMVAGSIVIIIAARGRFT